MARTRVDIPLTICGEKCHAKTDVCIVDENNILLLIQEDKRHRQPQGAERRPQLIAEAIATFQTNNYRRTHVLDQDPIVHKVIPGITLVGTSPIFYKIPVTSELAESVASGKFPAERTIVHAHLPELARPTRRMSEGMRPLDNRASNLACYEEFKRFVN